MKHVLVGHWMTGPAVLVAMPAVSGLNAAGTVIQCPTTTLTVVWAYHIGHSGCTSLSDKKLSCC